MTMLFKRGSSEWQTVLLGCVFLFVFMAYYMIQSFSANLYGAVLASDMETTLYGVFTIACFGAPAIVNLLGTRMSMFIGILGYGVLAAFSLLYYLNVAGSWLVVLGGSINGIGAALLWTGQGLIMLQYSDGNDGGRIFAIFWSIFNLSAVFGGFITYAYFSNEQSSGNVNLFIIFLALIIIGAFGALMLSPPRLLSRSLTPTSLPPQPLTTTSMKLEDLPNKTKHTSNILTEFTATIKLFQEPKMARMAMIFWYTGISQPYQLVTFGNRFFTKSTLGLMVSLFYTAEVIGSFCAASIVDPKKNELVVNNRARAIKGYAVFFIFVSMGYLIAIPLEVSHSKHTNNIPDRDSVNSLLVGAVVMFLWGFSDAMIQSLAYWRLSLFYTNDNDKSRGVGFYKMIQSAGWCVGFAISPSTRLHPVIQCIFTAGCYLIGLMLLELPSTVSLVLSDSGDSSGGVQKRIDKGDERALFSPSQLNPIHNDVL